MDLAETGQTVGESVDTLEVPPLALFPIDQDLVDREGPEEAGRH